MPTTAPYGSWKSPITADAIVAESIGLGAAAVDGNDLYWIESRPKEGGRQVLVKRDESGTVTDVTPAPFNVRTRVHEYGGGSYAVSAGTVYFANFADQRLYRISPGKSPEPLTEDGADLRYADMRIARDARRLYCVREDHRKGGEPVNTIVAISLDGKGEQRIVAEGDDFYAFPRLDASEKKIAWISWNHPNMPWDGSELWMGDLAADGSIVNKRKVAGGSEESVFQPEWSPDGTLYFVSDRSGWWNLYRWRDGDAEAMYPTEAEFGVALWQFGASTYSFRSAEEILCCYTRDGFWYLAQLDVTSKRVTPIPCPYSTIGGLLVYKEGVVFEGASPSEPVSIVYFNARTDAFSVLKRSSSLKIEPEYLSSPVSVRFPTKDGATAFGFYYPPKNGAFVAPQGEIAPLLVKSHGGPTAATSSRLNPGIQFWTSRGFAVLDVNYGGSTGYGREYMKRLEKQWGIVDVEDCVAGAQYLVEQGLVDPNRLAIFGGSAGGYTTLCALTFHDVFKAGASHYGIGDLEALVRDTHKFESRYPERLVGKYPEEKELYRSRSPIHSCDRLSCPVIFFQGLEDKVVPPNQAEEMVKALQKKGIPVEYVPFEGEQHGFRKAENIVTALNRELQFYGKVFGFETYP